MVVVMVVVVVVVMFSLPFKVQSNGGNRQQAWSSMTEWSSGFQQLCRGKSTGVKRGVLLLTASHTRHP